MLYVYLSVAQKRAIVDEHAKRVQEGGNPFLDFLTSWSRKTFKLISTSGWATISRIMKKKDLISQTASSRQTLIKGYFTSDQSTRVL